MLANRRGIVTGLVTGVVALGLAPATGVAYDATACDAAIAKVNQDAVAVQAAAATYRNDPSTANRTALNQKVAKMQADAAAAKAACS